MRLIVYGSFLILCCALIKSSLADDKYYKKSKDSEEYRGDKKYKTKYRTYYSDENPEDYKLNKHSGKRLRDEDVDYTREKKYQKYTKKANTFIESEEEPLDFKKNKKQYIARREKIFIPEDDVVEFLSEAKEKFSRNGRKETKQIRRKNGDSSAEKIQKNSNYKERRMDDDDDDDDDDDSEEEIPKMTFEKKASRKPERDTDDFEEEEEVEEREPERTFRKKIRVRIPDSAEDDSDESNDRETCEKKSKGGKGKRCDDGNQEISDKPSRSKKVKYSIKFAHEKEKVVPTEDDNIMKKIHRGEKRKYKYEHDDDDDSSEEHTHPKRLHLLDEDDD